jgi:hypothetical protein
LCIENGWDDFTQYCVLIKDGDCVNVYRDGCLRDEWLHLFLVVYLKRYSQSSEDNRCCEKFWLCAINDEAIYRNGGSGRML